LKALQTAVSFERTNTQKSFFQVLFVFNYFALYGADKKCAPFAVVFR